MASQLPPVPHRAPVLDDRGLVTPIWADWFNQLMTRVGGNIASTITELGGPVGTADLADDSVTADKLADHATTDASRAVTTNHIRDLAVTVAKLAGSIPFSKLAIGDWTVSTNATTGYLKLGSGIYLQWGVTASIASASTSSVAFPLAFPTACVQVLTSVRDNSAVATTATGQVGSGNYSAAGFDLYNRTSVAQVFNWFAVGF
jgi:hypothetical protein